VLTTNVTPVTLPPGRLRLGTRPRSSARCENNRNGCGCSFGSHCSRRGEGNDRIYGITHQVGGQSRQPVEAGIGRAIFDCDIASFDIASVVEALPKGGYLSIIQLSAAEQADQRHGRLLRTHRARPHRSAAKQCDEVAPFQSITSSARSSIDVRTKMSAGNVHDDA
jgi:hypothetical protein